MKYVVESRLGAGGMGEVFRARLLGAAGFSRPVAIKRMNAALSDDVRVADMFVREAHTAALLQHPNIVAVLDFDRDESGALFLAMELVDGADLARLLHVLRARGERMPAGLAAHIAAEALRGLGYAHDLVHRNQPLAIVHRDVSPQNLLVARTGAVKVADFGIAKVAESAAGKHTGGLKGKLAYMAPEQASSSPLDPRADLYAVGVVLYEMLSGERAFAGGSEAELLMKVLRAEVVPLAQRAPHVAADLLAVVDRLMAPDRERRFASALEAGDALRACRDFPSDGTSALARLVERLVEPTPAAGAALATQTAPAPTEPPALPATPAVAQPVVAAVATVAPPRRRPGRVLLAGLGVLAAAGVGLAFTRSREPEAARVTPLPPDAGPVAEPSPVDAAPRALAAAPVLVDAAPRAGRLVVRVTPSAIVSVDGVRVGTTPLEHELPPGAHVVELVNEPLGQHERVEVQVSSDAETRVERRFATPRRKPQAASPACDPKINPECLFQTKD